MIDTLRQRYLREIRELSHAEHRRRVSIQKALPPVLAVHNPHDGSILGFGCPVLPSPLEIAEVVKSALLRHEDLNECLNSIFPSAEPTPVEEEEDVSKSADDDPNDSVFRRCFPKCLR